MIAAAMTTLNPPAPTYLDLAKVGAEIERDIAPQTCERLLSEVAELAVVTTQLRFSLDDRQRMHVDGQAVAQVKLACQLCNLPVARELTAEIAGALAKSEAEAVKWRAQGGAEGVIVTSAATLNELELVEDELLLQLPSQVCVDADCEQRPALSYGSLDGKQGTDVPQEERQKPFAALAQLRSELDLK